MNALLYALVKVVPHMVLYAAALALLW